MRLLMLILILLSSSALVQAQNSISGNDSDDIEVTCEKGGGDGSIFLVASGKVVKIINEKTVRIRLNSNSPKFFGSYIFLKLVGINAKTNRQKAREFLTEKLLNLDVEVIGDFSTIKRKKKITGYVELENQDINRAMLENGIAEFMEPEPYKISGYSRCIYTAAEEKARQAKLGIWSNQ